MDCTYNLVRYVGKAAAMQKHGEPSGCTTPLNELLIRVQYTHALSQAPCLPQRGISAFCISKKVDVGSEIFTVLALSSASSKYYFI